MVLSFVLPTTSDSMVKYARRKRGRRRARTKRGRTSRARRTRRTVPKRRRLQGKKEALRTAIALGTGLQSAYEASKTIYDTINSGTAVAKRTKLRRGGSRTVTTRKKDDDGTGPYQQWSQRYAQATFGRMKLTKLINRESLIISWQNYSRFNQGRGVMWIGQANDTTNNARLLPCFLADLTSCPNHVSGSLANPSVLYQLYKSTVVGTDGNIGFKVLNGLNSTGGIASNWSIEKSEHNTSSASAYPGAQSVLAWSQIEMELWGQQQYHTKYTVELVQFHEDVCPQYDLALANTGGQLEMFWDAKMKSYTYSPLYQGNITGYSGPKLKVLKRYNVDIDPTSTTETNADPHVKTFRLFFRFNRRCNYGWKKSGGNGQNIAEFDDVDFAIEQNANEVTVHPSARIFLMIRATDFNVKATLAEQSVANTPSVSLKIRNKHMIVN